MKHKNLLKLGGAICLSAVIAIVLIVGCAAPEAPAPEEAKAVVEIVMAPFGGSSYILNQALESLSLKKDAPIRISQAEGPGCAACIKNWLENYEERKNHIGCSTKITLGFAAQGIGPFEKPYPDVGDRIKHLANYFFSLDGLVTLDPDIKTEQDLAGKRIGLGRAGQTGWTLVQLLAMENADPPVPVAGFQYLSPTGASEALIDGKVHAAPMCHRVSPDLTSFVQLATLKKLLATHPDVHWITFTESTQASVNNKLGIDYNWFQVPPNSLGGEQPEQVTLPLDYGTWSVDADYPEKLAYEFTKFLIQNCHLLKEYQAAAEVLENPEVLPWGWSDEELHPGALKAYQEAGIR